MFIWSWPVSRREIFAKADPLIERFSWKHARRAEKMNVIRHDHITADQPRFGLAPCVDDCCYSIFVGEDRLSVFSAHNHEKDHRVVLPLDWRRVWGMLAIRF